MFLKAPRPGLVKTRIAAALDGEAAAAIYRTLVGLTLSRLATWPEVELRFTPDDAESEVAGWCRPGWRLRSQGGGDLGERMARAVGEAFGEGAGPVVVLGTDCPEFALLDLERAVEGLRDHEVVLGPALDGGYWLIGLARPVPQLFRDIPWSTAGVWELTLARSREAGVRVRELRRLRDVDTLDDWRAWQREASL